MKINVSKSNIYGLGVNIEEVDAFAYDEGCNRGNFLFTYLGLPLGASMKRVNSWKPMVDRFRKWLVRWKSNLLSIGGRPTLIKSVLGSLGICFFLSLFKFSESVITVLESMRAKILGMVKTGSARYIGLSGTKYYPHVKRVA
ncbi:uncharacterized protein [Rutidosis leptorrhynchoides]|uniref:uncharacterized protein n=1 Tax=Rutidosis leptorrhynchoides TaxID=125765 RepID=UPI003A99524E